MRRYDEFEKVEAFTGEFEQLKAGGYVCKIMNVVVEDAKEGKNYDQLMTIDFDIVEGEFKEFYKRRYLEAVSKNKETAKWQGKNYQIIRSGEQLKYFKGFITAIEKSNSGYKWNWDEKSLVGNLFGGVFGEEEYLGSDEKVRCSVRCSLVRSVDEVRKGVKIPERKKVKDSNVYNNGFYPVDDNEEIPF